LLAYPYCRFGSSYPIIYGMKRRVAHLPLHSGKAPPWLFKRMTKLAGAVTMLGVALPRPQLSLTEAGDLIDYYRDRNKQATESHRKTWLARHPNVVLKKCCCKTSGPPN
jgi:hypothetical protein